MMYDFVSGLYSGVAPLIFGLIPALLYRKVMLNNQTLKHIAVYFVGMSLILHVCQFGGYQWNWSGKVLSICWSLLFVYFNKILNLENIGLVIRQAPGSGVHILQCVFLTLLIMPILLAMDVPKPYDLETLLFQATIPGLDEEIAYRGILLSLLMQLSNKNLFPRTRFEQSLALSVMVLVFSGGHIFRIDHNYHLLFNWEAGILALYYAYLWGWRTLKTRSLLWPICLHNTVNFLPQLSQMLRL